MTNHSKFCKRLFGNRNRLDYCSHYSTVVLLVFLTGIMFIIKMTGCSEAVPKSYITTVTDGIPDTWNVGDHTITAATPEGELELSVTYYQNSVGLTLVKIPAGEFLMGEDGEGGLQTVNQHYFMSAYEITNAQYQIFIEETGYDGTKDSVHDYLRHYEDWWGEHSPPEDDYPVTCISWINALRYCEWLSQREGLLYRLPTDMEWEYASRAGSTNNYYWGDYMIDDYAWYIENSNMSTQPVGLKMPNRFGLYDMLGNVQEWVQSAPEDYPYVATDGREATDEYLYRSIRGGSAFDTAISLTVFDRYYDTADHPYFSYGFRVMVEIP